MDPRMHSLDIDPPLHGRCCRTVFLRQSEGRVTMEVGKREVGKREVSREVSLN